jgi:hypothetical protein
VSPAEVPVATTEATRRPWWRPRWYELLPEVGLAAGLTIFLIDETDAATSAFKSSRALVLMAVVTAGWVLARVGLARITRWPLVRTGAFAAAAIGILAVVVVPAYDNDTVVESFPLAAADDVAPSAAPSPTSPVSPTDQPAAGAATTTTIPPPVATPTPATTTTTSPPRPVRFRVGSFRGVDHRAEGTVAFYRQDDGRYVVGLEDFDIQPGPDYDVYVVPGEDREDRDGGTRIDDLRGNRGTQYYEVPAGIALEEGPWTVLVWCQSFAVPVATATPK